MIRAWAKLNETKVFRFRELANDGRKSSGLRKACYTLVVEDFRSSRSQSRNRDFFAKRRRCERVNQNQYLVLNPFLNYPQRIPIPESKRENTREDRFRLTPTDDSVPLKRLREVCTLSQLLVNSQFFDYPGTSATHIIISTITESFFFYNNVNLCYSSQTRDRSS